MKNVNNVDYASQYAQMNAIPVGKDQKEETLIMIIAKAVEYVQKYAHLVQLK